MQAGAPSSHAVVVSKLDNEIMLPNRSSKHLFICLSVHPSIYLVIYLRYLLMPIKWSDNWPLGFVNLICTLNWEFISACLYFPLRYWPHSDLNWFQAVMGCYHLSSDLCCGRLAGQLCLVHEIAFLAQLWGRWKLREHSFWWGWSLNSPSWALRTRVLTSFPFLLAFANLKCDMLPKHFFWLERSRI